jgi:hypothetical protein
MLFPSIESGTDMNARESENYLPISRSFSASMIFLHRFIKFDQGISENCVGETFGRRKKEEEYGTKSQLW